MTAPTINPPGHPDTISSAIPVRVEKIVEAPDNHTVVVHVEPRHVMPGIIRALAGHAGDMLTVRSRHVGDAEWHAALARICNDTTVRDALAVTLGPDQAEDIGLDLMAASEGPAECDHCGGYVDIQGPDCSRCYDAVHRLDGRCGA